MIEVLLSYDADKNAKDIWGQTPLQGKSYAPPIIDDDEDSHYLSTQIIRRLIPKKTQSQ